MATWLAEQVGPTGHVVATDLNTVYLQRIDLPTLEVVEHNILEDSLEALGPGSFDLVCSRLMLFHLVGRQEQAIRRMMECLRPRRLADRRGRRLGFGRADRPHTPAPRQLPTQLAARGLVDRPRVRQRVRA